jgi:hypothetical protein
MNFKHIIFLGCSFTQMKTFYYDHEKEQYYDQWFANPDWTKKVAEATHLRHKNVGESGKSNGGMLLQYLKAKAQLPPKDPCLVIGGLTVTTRQTFRGYAGVNTFRGNDDEDAIGSKQWQNMVLDDGFVWQTIVDLGQLSEQVRDMGDELFVFGNHCELTEPQFIESLHTFITKHHRNINWGQPDINLRQLAREGLEVFANRMLNKIPPGFEPVKEKMDYYFPTTDEHKKKLEECLQIITRYSRIEQYHREEWLRNRIGDPGLNFNAFSSYFEQPDNREFIKVTTSDGHPNQIGSDLLAEYLHYNLTQHKLLENAGFEPFISSKYLKK